MKKITLVLATMFLLGAGITKASANEVIDAVERNSFPPIDYRYAEPIAFMERGVEFLVFPNGDFDFNTAPSNYAQPRNTTYGAPRSSSVRYYNTNGSQGVLIQHDNMGRVRRVGNVFINYDAQGRVKRIGSVYMSCMEMINSNTKHSIYAIILVSLLHNMTFCFMRLATTSGRKA